MTVDEACQHPIPVLVTTVSDGMPTWHCSGCGLLFRGDPDEIRKAEARGYQRAMAEIEDLRESLAHAEWREAEARRMGY